MNFRLFILFKCFASYAKSCLLQVRAHIKNNDVRKYLLLVTIANIVARISQVSITKNTICDFILDKKEISINFRISSLSSVKLVNATHELVGNFMNHLSQESQGLCKYEEEKKQNVMVLSNEILEKVFFHRNANSYFLPKGFTRLFSTPPYSFVFEYIKNENENFILKMSVGLGPRTLNEGALGMEFQHENVIKTYDTSTVECKYKSSIQKPGEDWKGKICFILIELFGEKINSYTFDNSIESLRNLAKQLLKALKYLHDLDCIHVDIKTENIVYARNEKGEIVYKLIDFGFSLKLDPGSSEIKDSRIYGTKECFAPEVYKEHIYGKFNDIWCLGVTIYECYKRKNLEKKAYENIVDDCFQLVFEEDTDKSLKDFLKKCLVVDYRKRATVDELLDHPFIRGSSNEILT